MKHLTVLLILATLLLTGCVTEPSNDIRSPESASVSAIPWNKPASWEGSGALGGFSPQGGGH
jgi:starvation-inducible outer membrane lipoprotein